MRVEQHDQLSDHSHLDAVRTTQGSQYTGQSTFVDAAGRCAYVFNTGATDVFWGPSTHPRHAAIPGAPGATGMTDGAIWVSNIGSTSNGRAAAWRVDLRTGNVTKPFTWQTWRGTPAMRRRGSTAIGAAGAGLYEYRNLLYFLEEARLSAPRTDGIIPVAPDKAAQLRLGSLDLADGAYRSTYLTNLPGGVTDRSDGSVSPAAAACAKTYRAGASVYTCDAEGKILRIDLRTRTLSVIGRLSNVAQQAPDAVVAFSAESMTMVVINTRSGRTTAEAYNLHTGKRGHTTELDGVASLVKDNRLITYDATALGS